MNLLYEEPGNFRYYLMTSTNNDIIILFYKSPSDIDSNDQTILETTYMDLITHDYIIDEKQTKKVTCKDDEMQINLFNSNIESYCRSRYNVNSVRIINAEYNYKLIFEPKVFKAMNQCSKNLYFDLGESAFRTTTVNYDQLSSIEIQSGTWMLDDTTTIYTENFKATSAIINIYNGSQSNIKAFNLIASESIKATRLQIYSTIHTHFTYQAIFPTKFSNSKINIAYLNIFGQECLDDKAATRITIKGFNKCNIGRLEIDDDVRYGSIFAVDLLTSMTISSIVRNVNSLETGTFITVNRVGTVSLYDINFNITKSSTFVDGTALVAFKPNPDTELKRKLNIYNTTINNEANRKLTICKLNNASIEKVYISKCTVADGITVLEKDDKSQLTKLNYNECTFNSSGDFKIENTIKSSLVDVNFNIDGNLIIESQNVTANGGVWNFNKFILDNSENMIIKFATNNVEMHGNEIEFKNSAAEDDGDYYDNESTFDVDKISIGGYKVSLGKSSLLSSNVEISSSKTTSLNKIYVGFPTNKTNIKINSSLTGNITFNTEEDSNTEFNLMIRDVEKALSMNAFDFLGIVTPPKITIDSNVPFKSIFNNIDTDYAYAKLTEDYDSKQSSKITYIPIIGSTKNFKVINNSEKYATISNYTDEYFKEIWEIKRK